MDELKGNEGRWKWLFPLISIALPASVAIGIYWWQSDTQIAITQAQLRPHIDIWYSEDETGAGFKQWSNGLGPAFFKEFIVFVKASEDEKEREVDDWGQVFQELGEERGPQPFYDFKYGGSVYPPDEPITIFWQEKGYGSDFLKENHDRIGFKYCYCSFYQKCWRGSSRGSVLEKEDSCEDAGRGFDGLVRATTVSNNSS